MLATWVLHGMLAAQAAEGLTAVLAFGAPPEAARVVAYFPFGVSRELAPDGSGQWRGRAVVSVPEGSYPVAVVVETRDGGRVVRREQVRLRRDEPAFQARFSGEHVAAGDTAELRVDAVEPAVSVVARAPTLWTGTRPLGPSTGGSRTDWGALWKVPDGTAAGTHAVEVTVTDVEGRTFTRTLALDVVRAEAR